MLKTLEDDCQQFLNDLPNKPLVKSLPKLGDSFRKVKARKRKIHSTLDRLMHTSFQTIQKRIISTAITAYNTEIFENISKDHEEFFIFPIDNYKILCCNSITNYKKQFDLCLNNLLKISDIKFAANSILELLQTNYDEINSFKELKDRNVEMLIYNIPYFYAVRCSSVENYEILIT